MPERRCASGGSPCARSWMTECRRGHGWPGAAPGLRSGEPLAPGSPIRAARPASAASAAVTGRSSSSRRRCPGARTPDMDLVRSGSRSPSACSACRASFRYLIVSASWSSSADIFVNRGAYPVAKLCPGAGCNAERVPPARVPPFPPETGRREEEKAGPASQAETGGRGIFAQRRRRLRQSSRNTDGERDVPATGVPGGGITLRTMPGSMSPKSAEDEAELMRIRCQVLEMAP